MHVCAHSSEPSLLAYTYTCSMYVNIDKGSDQHFAGLHARQRGNGAYAISTKISCTGQYYIAIGAGSTLSLALVPVVSYFFSFLFYFSVSRTKMTICTEIDNGLHVPISLTCLMYYLFIILIFRMLHVA